MADLIKPRIWHPGDPLPLEGWFTPGCRVCGSCDVMADGMLCPICSAQEQRDMQEQRRGP